MAYPVVQRATFPPGKCLVTGDIDGPFLDFGDRTAVDPRVYIHVPVVEACARQLGMVPKAEVEAIQTQLAELESKYAALDRYREAIEAIEVAEQEMSDA